MGNLCGGGPKTAPPVAVSMNVSSKKTAAPAKKADALQAGNTSAPVAAPVAASAPPVIDTAAKLEQEKKDKWLEQKKIDEQKEQEKQEREKAELAAKLEAEEKAKREAEELEKARKKEEEKKKLQAKIKSMMQKKVSASYIDEAQKIEAEKEAERQRIELDKLKMRELVEYHQVENAKKHPDYKMLSKASRALVIQILNLTSGPVNLVHSQMDSGKHNSSTNKEIAPLKFEQFTFHNDSAFKGLCGELYLNGTEKIFRCAFSNPLVGCCKGILEIRNAGEQYDYKQWGGIKLTDNNMPQNHEFFDTAYMPDAAPPIYTIILQNW